MIYIVKLILYIILIIISIPALGQEQLVYTKSFTKKIERVGLEFFRPVERWMKAAPTYKDDFMNYDLVLHSYPDLEARIKIDRDTRRKPVIPNVEITRLIASMATNRQASEIKISKYQEAYAREQYGADLVLFADFEPKEGFSNFSKGRILCLYKKDRALVSYIILYNEDLEPYFETPLRFKVLEVDQ